MGERKNTTGVWWGNLKDRVYLEGPGIGRRTILRIYLEQIGDRSSTVVKVLCYKSEGRWFDPSWCQWIFH